MTLQTLRGQLPSLTYNDYLRHLPEALAQAGGAKPLRVAVLRSYTVEPIEPVLTLQLVLEGYRPEFWFGGFNQYVQEMLDPGSPLYGFKPDVVLLLTRIEDVLPDFTDAFPSRDAAAWEPALVAKAGEMAALAERVVAGTSAQVLVQNAVLHQGHYGAFDAQHGHGQLHLLQAYNRALSQAVGAVRGAFVWDVERLVRQRGADVVYDAKAWYVARNPFRQSAYPALAADLCRYVGSALGRLKKCVVVDLDNTLWGGVVGEDGFDGIKLGHSYPGSCYRDFQRELLKLFDRGILLAICSKNNEADALKVIDDHPDMVLRREHFAAMRINWQDKAANIRELARELNIGVDSLVFLDDNPAECEQVRQACPGCDVVLLPDKPYLLPSVPASLPGVDNVRLTAEDRQRGAMYQAQAARRELEDQFSNVEAFLESLQMQVGIEPASGYSIPRIAQLTQKTNQMNMTTRRYTEAQVRAFAADSGKGVFSVTAKDRFGDHGIIGVMILDYADACRIDTFLLSCRVIGRGIEEAMIAFASEQAAARRLDRLVGEFLPTPKNKPAEGFYARIGFADQGDGTLVADLRERQFPVPHYLDVVAAGTEATKGSDS